MSFIMYTHFTQEKKVWGASHHQTCHTVKCPYLTGTCKIKSGIQNANNGASQCARAGNIITKSLYFLWILVLKTYLKPKQKCLACELKKKKRSSKPNLVRGDVAKQQTKYRMKDFFALIVHVVGKRCRGHADLMESSQPGYYSITRQNNNCNRSSQSL